MSVSEFIVMNRTRLKRFVLFLLAILLFRWALHLMPTGDGEQTTEQATLHAHGAISYRQPSQPDGDVHHMAQGGASSGRERPVVNGPAKDLIHNHMQERMDTHPDMVAHQTRRPVHNGPAKVQGPMQRTGLTAQGDSFYLDGQPFRILSGSFHYFRTQPAQWNDRLMKMKAAGLNTVTTYIPWNLHEKHRGEYSFGGRWDIASFIQHVQEVGLKLIIRPGPYICAEWEYGGLPSWLLADPNMVIRDSTYKPFLAAVERFFGELFRKLVPYQYQKGAGPIIAFQVENEFGSYRRDPEYLAWLKRLYIRSGLIELLFTSDGDYHLANGTTPDVLATVNFMKNPEKALRALQKFQPNKPLMVTEFWAGWFDHWGERHHTTDPEEFRRTVSTIIGTFNASINFYMFVGGTNFEFWNGANNGSFYQPTITSYDYDAPISESGNLNKKYFVVRKLIEDLGLNEEPLPAVPANNPTKAYGMVKMEWAMPYSDMLPLIEKSVNGTTPLMMEQLDINNGGGQGYGILLYRAVLPEHSTKMKIHGSLYDIGLVFQDYQPRDVFDWNSKRLEANLTQQDFTTTLDIFVENAGRVNYRDFLNEQRRGIKGTVSVDGRQLVQWQHYPLEFDPQFMAKLQASSAWRNFLYFSVPCLYRGTFNVVELVDTFLNISDWQKGYVFINGYNIGRYWAWGPQRTLYVPAPLLIKGANEIIIFEIFKAATHVEFIDAPVLGF